MKKLSLLLIFSLIFTSCNSSKENKLLFKKEISIKGKQVLKNEVNIIELNSVNKVIIASLRNDSHHIKIFLSDNLEPVGKYLKKGNGPDEYQGPLAFCGFNSMNSIYMYDINSCSFYGFSIDNKFKKTLDISINPKYNLKKPFFIDSTKLISNSSNLGLKMNDLIIYNYLTDSISLALNVIPKPKINLKKRNINFIFNRYNHLFTNSISVRPDMKKIAVAYFFYNRIDIFNSNGNFNHTILDFPSFSKSNQKIFLESKKYHMPTRYYTDVFSSNKFIYALFKKKPLNKKNKLITSSSEIRVFDWTGNPLLKINIQDNLTNFTVDVNNKIIYGIDFEQEKILSYNLKNILNEL